MTHLNLRLNIIAAVSLLTISACGDVDEKSAARICYADAADATAISVGLTNSAIPFSRDANCLIVDDTLQARVAEVQVEIFGIPPPPGRNMSRDIERNREAVELLAREGIETSIVRYHGQEYITWSDEDADRVEGLLDLQPEVREWMQKQRAENKNHE